MSLRARSQASSCFSCTRLVSLSVIEFKKKVPFLPLKSDDVDEEDEIKLFNEDFSLKC